MVLIDSYVGEALSGWPGKRALAVINRMSANPRHLAATQARNALVAGCRHMRPVDETLCERVIFQRAYTAGRTVMEYQPKWEKANAEVPQTKQPPVSRSRGAGSGQLAERPKKPERKYLALRPPEDLVKKLHIVTAARGMTPTDYVLNHLTAQIEEGYEEVIRELHSELRGDVQWPSPPISFLKWPF